jgi:hypothetical protein
MTSPTAKKIYFDFIRILQPRIFIMLEHRKNVQLLTIDEERLPLNSQQNCVLPEYKIR